MTGFILALNAGSSSLKFALFDIANALAETHRGEIENLSDEPYLSVRDASGACVLERRWVKGNAPGFDDLLKTLLSFIDGLVNSKELIAIGHRVVHGGTDFVAPKIVTHDVLLGLQKLIPLDPLHMPDNLAPIDIIARQRPMLKQIVCFDTAFHHGLPLVAQQFALPRALFDAGIRRYGFHGLSYEYIANTLATQVPQLAAGRVIVAHLGSGASLCALQNGKSVATSMGFSVLDGLMMATRCGALDPGIIFYLVAQGHNLADIEGMLYHRSGLLGVSCISGDVRTLLVSADSRALEALDLFTYRIACTIGTFMVALGGLDGLVFTAGIGANAPEIRASVCAHLDWLGVQIDSGANGANAECISTNVSKIAVRVMPTNEEAMIAKHTLRILS